MHCIVLLGFARGKPTPVRGEALPPISEGSVWGPAVVGAVNFELRVKEYLGWSGKLPSSLELEEPIEIPERILAGINAVREVQAVNMFDVRIVQAQAVALEYLETALWIEANPATYYNGMFKGFAALSN